MIDQIPFFLSLSLPSLPLSYPSLHLSSPSTISLLSLCLLSLSTSPLLLSLPLPVSLSSRVSIAVSTWGKTFFSGISDDVYRKLAQSFLQETRKHYKGETCLPLTLRPQKKDHSSRVRELLRPGKLLLRQRRSCHCRVVLKMLSILLKTFNMFRKEENKFLLPEHYRTFRWKKNPLDFNWRPEKATYYTETYSTNLGVWVALHL